MPERKNIRPKEVIRVLNSDKKWKTVEMIAEQLNTDVKLVSEATKKLEETHGIVRGYMRKEDKQIYTSPERYKTETKGILKLVDFFNRRVIR